MRELKITPTALADAQDAMDYYNSRQAGLGDRFEEILSRYFEAIASQPEAGTFYRDNVRYRVVRQFPYLIFYRFDGLVVIVLRIFNTYQNPERI